VTGEDALKIAFDGILVAGQQIFCVHLIQ
jgi:hypothetical protein